MAKYVEIVQETLDARVDSLMTPELAAEIEKFAVKYRKVYDYKEGWGKNPKLKLMVRKSPNASVDIEGSNYYSLAFYLNIVGDENMNQRGVMAFEIDAYPYCCGMKQLNGFNYTGSLVSEELVHKVLDLCIKAYRQTQIRCTRLMLNMVEFRSGMNRYDETQEIEDKGPDDVQYKYIYTWAKKQLKCRDSLMMNGNSGNILHHMEVIVA